MEHPKTATLAASQPAGESRSRPVLGARAGAAMLLLFLATSQTVMSGAAAEDDQNEALVAEVDRETLFQQHNELASRVKMLWQQGKDREALHGLRQLLALYQQIYPRSEFPQGHAHVVRCYRDLCRVTDQLGERELLLKYCQEGLAMCRRLHASQEPPPGDANLACMLANTGNAMMQFNRFAEARDHFLEAIQQYKLLAVDTRDGTGVKEVAELYRMVGATHLRHGNLLQAMKYTTLAVEVFQGQPAPVSHDAEFMCYSDCLARHAKVLRSLGMYQESVGYLQRALDINLRLYLATRSMSSHLALVDLLVEMGVLMRQRSDLIQAEFYLDRAGYEIAQLDPMNGEVVSRKLKVLSQLLSVSQVDENQSDIVRYKSELETLLRADGNRLIEWVGRGSLAEIKMELGRTCQLAGETGRAEEYLLDALRLVESVDSTESCHDFDQQVVCCNNYLGNFYQEMGRYERAYGCYVTALARAREMFPRSQYPQGHPVLSAALQNMATHLWLLGDTEVAAAYYREALGMNERLYPSDEYPQGHRLLMAAYMAWGNVLVREGRYDDAEEYLRKAQQMATAQYPTSAYPDGHDELVQVWRSLGRLERAKLRCEEAAAFFDKSLRSYRQRYSKTCSDGRLRVAMMLAELGRTYCVAGDYGRAERYYEQSLAIRRSLFSIQDYPQGHPSLANALRDFGYAHHLAGRHEEAFELFMESARMEHAIAESFFGGGSEATLLNLAAHRFQSLDYLLDAWRYTDRPASEAYEYVWLRRGFVPRLITQRNRMLRRVASEGAVVGLAQYLEVRRDLSRTLLVSTHQEMEGETPQLSQIRELNAHKERLEHQLARQLGRIGADMAPQNAGPTLLAQSLPDDAVLIDYVRYSCKTVDALVPVADRTEQSRLVAYVIARGRAVVCVDLGEADEIETLVAMWRKTLLEERWSAAGDRLRRAVWDPVFEHVPVETHTVYIAPDGALSSVAWGALPSPAPAQFLVEKYAIATVPHGPFLLERLRQPDWQQSQRGVILAVGDVDYGTRTATPQDDKLGLKQASWSPLEGSAAELASLAAAADPRECVLLTGTSATTARVLEQLPGCRWAHFATHGFFVDDSFEQVLQLASGSRELRPLTVNPSRTTVLGRCPFVRSGLALTGANEVGALDEMGMPREARGILTAEAIAAVDCRHLELVVLSACETGRGDVAHGDGVFGTQTAFHVAGARNVIATLWKIDDAATANLMGDFYRLVWHEKLTPLEALRGAQIKMIRGEQGLQTDVRGPVLAGTVPLVVNRNGQRAFTARNVRHWAGFVLSGPGF